MMYSSLANKKTPDSWLAWFLKGLMALGLLILIARMVELQVIKGAYFENLGNGNRTRRISIIAARGEIKDRNGQILAGNLEVKKRIIFDPKEGYIKTDNILESKDSEIITESKRHYFAGSLASHLIGYLGEVNKEELGKINPDCSQKGPRGLGDLVGRSGLEEEYDCLLKGVDGEKLIEIDAKGNEVRVLGERKAVPGETLTTTLDLTLQEKAAKAMGKAGKGAFIATNSKGGILAFYSSPSFDNNQSISNFINDSSLPLFNRVIGGVYHPGSVFKLITAVAGLEESKITPSFEYNDLGVIKIGDFSYANWYFTQYGRTEGLINLKRALARSTDTFFYKVGEMVGAETIANWAKRFGLGQKSGIDLPGEVENLIPTPAWKKEVKKELWFLGNTYHLAIGQGDLALTPLSVNMMTLGLVRGEVCKPYFLQENERCQKIAVNKDSLEEIKKGMIEACSKGGTAYPFFELNEKLAEDKKIACKTGTAETEEKDKTHAWFTMIVPTADDYIVLTVLMEKGGEGSSVAAPIAYEVLNGYLKN